MRINGKDYKIPEITLSTVRQLEKYGVFLMDENSSKSILTVVSGFLCMTAHIRQQQADEIIEQRFLNGEGVTDYLEEINIAFEKSDFINKIINKPKEKNQVLRFRFNNGSEL